MTLGQKLEAWLKKCKIRCSCGKDIVCYNCTDPKCPYFKADPLYCRECLTLSKHDHFPHKLI